MKRIISLLLITTIALSGCKKDEECPTVTTTAPAAEVAALKAYLDANSITAIADARGFFYTVVAPGGADKPTTCQTVTVGYVGRLTTGSVFGSDANATFQLSGLITGWQQAIPLMGVGGSIVLYLPPSLAYGSSSRELIPANSNLVFTIDLKGFN